MAGGYQKEPGAGQGSSWWVKRLRQDLDVSKGRVGPKRGWALQALGMAGAKVQRTDEFYKDQGEVKVTQLRKAGRARELILRSECGGGSI